MTFVRIEHLKPWKRSHVTVGRARGWCDGMLVIEREFHPGGRYDSLGDPKRSGDYGLVEAIEGAWVMRRVYFRADGTLIGELFNIQTPTEIEPGVVRYTDLEVDVARHGDGRVEVVDQDDLKEAVRVGGISPAQAAKALAIAQQLAAILRRGGDWRDAAFPGPTEQRLCA